MSGKQSPGRDTFLRLVVMGLLLGTAAGLALGLNSANMALWMIGGGAIGLVVGAVAGVLRR